MHSPLTRFRGEALPGIGHNQGPPLHAGHGFRVHAWKKARAKLMPKLPLEVLKRRVARAKALGLAYPAYASILLGTGRDVIGFLFTANAIGLRLERGSLPAERVEALTAIQAARLLMVPGVGDVPRAQAALPPNLMAHIGPGPIPRATAATARRAIRALLEPGKMPSDAVILIGTEPSERDWADAARLAKFLPAESYFSPT